MAKMKFTSPVTTAQRAYFARSANMRFWAGLLVLFAPLVWAVADFVGLSGYIMPEHPLLSYTGTGLFLFFAHGLLIASALMVGYDIFDNNQVEHKAFVALPILLTAGLLWFSWIGMEKIYLTRFAHKATIVSTEKVDAHKTKSLADNSLEADANTKRIKEPYGMKREAKTNAANSEIAKINRRKTYDDNDVRKKKRDIEAVKSRLVGELSVISEAEADELAEVNKAVTSYSNSVSAFHAKDIAAISNQNNYEIGLEMSDKQAANGKSFWFSVFMALLFWGSVLTRTRLDCKSGIIPTFEHTDGDKSDRVRETIFVINAILGSRYSRLLSRMHDSLAVEYETVTPKRKAISTPPQNGGDTEGGNGGGNQPTPTTPIAPAQPEGGASVQKKYKQKEWGKLPNQVQVSLAMNLAESEFGDDYDITKVTHALSDLNPIISITDDFKEFKTCLQTDKDIAQILKAYNRTLLNVYPTPSVPITETEGGLRSTGVPIDFDKLEKELTPYFRTPLTDEEKKEADEHFGINSQSMTVRTVPQPNDLQAPSVLDDKLMLLRSKILKYGESHFNNTQANDSTVANAIFKLCDEAYLALRERVEVSKQTLTQFQQAAENRLDLCKKFKFDYDSRTHLFSLIQKRAGES